MSANLFGWSDAFWLRLDQWGILLGLSATVLALAGSIWAFFQRDHIRRWLIRNRFPHLGDDLVDEERWQGLVFTISRPELPEFVIRELRPERIGLVASRESLGAADKIAQLARTLGIQAEIREIGDADNPAETRDAAKHLLESLRLAGADSIAVDVTGGKTPMSLGAFMAAEEAGAATLYVTAQFEPSLKVMVMGSERVRIISRPT